MRTTAFRMSSVLTSESNPRDARLIARRSNGSALHTLDHQFSKSRAQKVAAQTPMLTGCPDPGQGGLTLEDTTPPTHPTRPACWPNPDAHGTFIPHGAPHRPPRRNRPPDAPRPAPGRGAHPGGATFRHRPPLGRRATRTPEPGRPDPQRPRAAHQRRRVGHARRRGPARPRCGGVPGAVRARSLRADGEVAPLDGRGVPPPLGGDGAPGRRGVHPPPPPVPGGPRPPPPPPARPAPEPPPH